MSLIKYPKINLSSSGQVDYDEYWRARRREVAVLSRYQKQRADIVLKIIEKGAKVLDVGCGDGAVLKYLKDQANIEGIGVDLSEKILTQAKQIGIEVIQMDITKLENLEALPEADYILGFEILEHLPNPEEFILKMKNKARQGLIFSFPNSGYFRHRLRLLLGRFPLQWVYHPGEHLRFWTVKDVKWWAAAFGFDLDRLIVYEGPLGLRKIWPALFGEGIIIKIKK